MTTLLDVQRALLARDYDIGKSRDDGLPGPATFGAMLRALNEHVPLPIAVSPPPVADPIGLVPMAWMPWAQMTRIVFHWTAGGNKASLLDRKHYHLLVEHVDGVARLVRGVPSIVLNDAPLKKGYAAHTLNLNGDAIGTTMCGMAGAQESPFKAGSAPIIKAQWDLLVDAHVDLCRRYSIPVTPKTLLSHAEVQATLGVRQRGKWDIAVLPFDPSFNTAKKVGDRMRAEVQAKL
jgi:hypothetical protein